MKRILLAASALAMIAAPAAAQNLTVNLTGNVASVCGAYNSGATGGVLNLDFGQLANTDATAQVALGGFNATYICNSAAGMTRTISSANGGYLFRTGTSGGSANQVEYSIQHGGGSGLNFSEQGLSAPIVTVRPGSTALMAGQGGTVTLRADGVRIPSPANAAFTTTNVFAGDYTDVLTIAVVAN
ncbi:hypothetical protein IWC96_12475 [Brevundimonas sp. BAL450]|jgi:hypothetical protein|uniref:Spore coat protein U domain-containing protein n=1 Tax=Brevundimonas abyssalis TAR-001 TaxID=1391729 RepID=A0A8E0NC00_9CAUL|nr:MULTISPECIES: hypothetical protein [Brevundimonas]MBG7616086.1 hypothetical protein [Brevundimonas sp. BAL450]GAD59583.1 hypothetical protein MBEBAB_1833 [Brevundimonas abyssalis TAR-001]